MGIIFSLFHWSKFSGFGLFLLTKECTIFVFKIILNAKFSDLINNGLIVGALPPLPPPTPVTGSLAAPYYSKSRSEDTPCDKRYDKRKYCNLESEAEAYALATPAHPSRDNNRLWAQKVILFTHRRLAARRLPTPSLRQQVGLL